MVKGCVIAIADCCDQLFSCCSTRRGSRGVYRDFLRRQFKVRDSIQNVFLPTLLCDTPPGDVPVPFAPRQPPAIPEDVQIGSAFTRLSLSGLDSDDNQVGNFVDFRDFHRRLFCWSGQLSYHRYSPDPVGRVFWRPDASRPVTDHL